MFLEQREEESQNLRGFLDDEYQQIESTHIQQKQVLNEIFEAWAEIFSGRSKDNLKSKSSEGDNF